MKVLLAHNRYRVPGGEERHVDLLEQGLTQAGVVVRRFERDSRGLESSFPARVTSALTLAYRPGGGGIGRAIDGWAPNVVHFHNVWPLLTPAALRIARTRGAAVVLTVHNYRFACPGGTLLRNGHVHEDCVEGSSLACAVRSPRGRLGESLAYGVALELQRRLRMLERWVDAFVAPSRFVARMLERAGIPGERIHLIGNGVPDDEPQPGGSRYAFYAGRLSEEKGVRTLIEAARLAPEVPVVVAGDGPLAELVRKSAVTYLGRLDRAETAAALADSSFAVAPSEWYENQPLAVLEALSAGKPVIATGLGGLPEIVKDGVNGAIVPPRSPAELARTMQLLWRDPDRTRRLGEQARVAAREAHSLERQTRSLVALYEAVAR
jgi:glycosyltransferase involved in cell wall biosynthesis